MIKIIATIFFICLAAACNEKDFHIASSSDRPEQKLESAKRDTTLAERLAEEFMSKQPDAERYSKRANGVFQEEIGVFIVRFSLLDNSSKNAALVNVILSKKRCKRIQVM